MWRNYTGGTVMAGCPGARMAGCPDAPGAAFLRDGSMDNVYVYDLGRLTRIYQSWRALLPEVAPHYAVKCNPDPQMVKVLAELGCSFDCASPAEIAQVLAAQVPVARIIYANPCKRPADLAFAAERGVRTTTFDSLCELDKVLAHAPDMALVLRIYAHDPGAQCVMSHKYGATEEEWPAILARARQRRANLVGVSFHIGSGACNPGAFTTAIEQARKLADLARDAGFVLSLVDIGGGFTVANFRTMAVAVRAALARCFPPGAGVRCISEPGRLFAESIACLYTSVIGVRQRGDVRSVTITDSIYGSFNCIANDHALPVPVPLGDAAAAECVPTQLFMESCDGYDAFPRLLSLPRLQYGDRLLWRNMGAYTVAASSAFNGMDFARPRTLYTWSEADADAETETKNETSV